jgi:hypothetical protein
MKKSKQKKSRLHFSFLSAMAMVELSTMGASHFLYLFGLHKFGNEPILRKETEAP